MRMGIMKLRPSFLPSFLILNKVCETKRTRGSFPFMKMPLRRLKSRSCEKIRRSGERNRVGARSFADVRIRRRKKRRG